MHIHMPLGDIATIGKGRQAMEIVVLGAGMVGVSSALALQERGHQVVLVDRQAPGLETSFGNGGMIQAEAAEPYAFPRRFGTVAKIALGLSNDVKWRWSAIPSHWRPLLSYFRHSAPEAHARISRVYALLTGAATRDQGALIEAAGSDNLIQKDGFRQIFRSARAMDRAAAEAERVFASYGVRSRVQTEGELADQEPGLRTRLAGAVHWLDTWSCRDPGELVASYVRLFQHRGGRLARGDANSLRQQGNRWIVDCEGGAIEGAAAVIALGPWSAQLLARYGYKVPLFAKRGYHRHYAISQGPRLPIHDTENGIFFAPMAQGLRICTGAELTRFGAAPSSAQLDRGERVVSELYRLGESLDPLAWSGSRPCMPDMLPVVGPAPRHPGLWLNFGHGHQGFTLGPTTARILADQVSGQRADAVADALKLDRKWI